MDPASRSTGFRNSRRARTFLVFSGVIFLAYGILLAAFSNSGFPVTMKTGSRFPYLCDKPVGEDAYYMLTVARNIARGEGIVYNAQKKTSGIQPLVTFIYAGLFWIVQKFGGDKWAFIRIVLIFGVIAHIFLAHIIGRISLHLAGDDLTDRSGAYALGFWFACLNFTLFRISTYGLETAVYLLILSLATLSTFKSTEGSRLPWRKVAILGCLFGLAALTRIDFVVVAAIFLFLSFLRRKLPLWQAALIGCVAFLSVSPWLLWVKSASGSWVPSSGQTQAIFMSSSRLLTRLWTMILSLADHATPWAYEANRGILIVLGATSGLAVIVWLWKKHGEDLKASLISLFRNHPFYLEWTVSIMLLIIIYTGFFWARHFYIRYSAPVLILYLPFLAHQVNQRLKHSRRWIERGLIAGIFISFAATAFVSFHTGTVGNSLALNAGFIQEEFPESTRIGAFQSGVLGYFHENVSNLDGKIDALAFKHIQSGSMAQYLDDEKIDVIIDWPRYVYVYSNIDHEYLKSRWMIYPKKIPEGLSICLVRRRIGVGPQ